MSLQNEPNSLRKRAERWLKKFRGLNLNEAEVRELANGRIRAKVGNREFLFSETGVVDGKDPYNWEGELDW